MEDDSESSSGPSMVPLALALLAIVLGGAGLYFGLTANQQLAPISQSIDEGSSSAARFDKQVSSLETRLVELSAQTSELSQTVDRLRVYGTQNEQLAKQVAGAVKSNRDELIKLAGKMSELASASTPSPAPVAAATNSTASRESSTASSTESTAAGSASNYVIKPGDTFAKIALQQDVSLNDLLDANPDADPRRLRIGQEINIPEN